MEKRIVSATNGVWGTTYPYTEELNWTHMLYYTQKINSKWVKDLNLKDLKS